MFVIDEGLLSPVTANPGFAPLMDAVSDATIVDALVAAEVGLVRALAAVGPCPPHIADEVSRELGWRGRQPDGERVSAAGLAAAGVEGGNPVIPLVALLRARLPEDARAWLHRGATSQDILDTALMIVMRDAADRLGDTLAALGESLGRHAASGRHDVAAGRTLTQHAVPTTVGARVAGWLRGVDRAAQRLASVRASLPAQLGGAGATLASFVELAGPDAAARLPAAFASELGLAAPDAPWHVQRWPITELGDALVQATDALGKLATDVATLSRTEIGELVEGDRGGSSAMPQKQNPTRSVLIRSAAIRAPQLGATLHLAAVLAADERPDGAWHAEWPTLRELMRLALGAAATAEELIAGLRVDRYAVARNLALTHGLIVSERLGIVLTPLIGRERFAALVADASAGVDLGGLVRALPEASGLDVDALLDPAEYTGLADELVRSALREDGR